jgi:hypothetical protein
VAPETDFTAISTVFDRSEKEGTASLVGDGETLSGCRVPESAKYGRISGGKGAEAACLMDGAYIIRVCLSLPPVSPRSNPLTRLIQALVSIRLGRQLPWLFYHLRSYTDR